MQKPKLKFKLLLLGILTFSILGLAKNASAGTAFYFDGSDTGSQNLGTFAEPFNTMAKVNQHPFATGDDLYFKAGTTYLVPAGQFLDVDWNGTAGDWVIIGAYYGENQFGLNSGARPIIDGNGLAPAKDSYLGLFDKQNGSHADAYVEVKDLRLNNAGESGISLMYVNQFKITNCYIYQSTWSTGIIVGRSNNVIVDGNTVERSAYRASALMAGIVVTASRALGTSQNCQVLNNTVFLSHGEGIDIIHGAENVLVSGNTVYDNMSTQIYCDSSRYIDVTNNVVYRSSTAPSTWVWNGIFVENEAWAAFCYAGNVNIHGNYIANINVGLSLSSEYQPCTVNNIKFYDNILADSTINFEIFYSTASWTGNNYYNNVSYTSNNATMMHANSYSPAGLTWGKNIFDDAVSGNAASEDCTVASPLEKTSGWNNLTAGAVSAADFALSSIGSAGRLACFGGGGDTTAPSAPSGLSVE